MAPDHRPQRSKAKIKWHESWLLDNDVNGDLIGEWCRKEDFQTAKCAWCGSTFKFNSQGFTGLKKHAKSEAHKVIANTRKGRVPEQLLLDVSTAADRDYDKVIDGTESVLEEDALETNTRPLSDYEEDTLETNTQTVSGSNNNRRGAKNKNYRKRKNPFLDTESEEEDTQDRKKSGFFSIFNCGRGANNSQRSNGHEDLNPDEPEEVSNSDANANEEVSDANKEDSDANEGDQSNTGDINGGDSPLQFPEADVPDMPYYSSSGESGPSGEDGSEEPKFSSDGDEDDESNNPPSGSRGEGRSRGAGDRRGLLGGGRGAGREDGRATRGCRGGGRDRVGGRGGSSRGSTRPTEVRNTGPGRGQRWLQSRTNNALLRLRPEPPLLPKKISLNDKVEVAEIRMALKVVESNYSYQSMDNMAEVLRAMDPKSEVFQKYSMKRNKTSALISHGLHPFFRRKLIESLLQAPGYCLGTDASTFKQGDLGLSKHVDYVFRFWDEKFGGVVDRFGGYASVGKEPADVQVREILKLLHNDSIPLVKMLSLSRDNPKVMQKTYRDLEAEVLAAGNPRLIDNPCMLHPTHTAFAKCMTALVEKDEEGEPTTTSISSLLNHLFGFFQVSTARREDVVELRIDLQQEHEDFNEALYEFFMRHIVTRWLESQPCLERLLNHWTSTTTYFMEYLPTKNDQCSKQAMKTDRYKAIASCFSPTQIHKTKIRVKFLIFICKICRPFLLKFQSERPQAYQLFDASVQLFKDIAKLILKPTAYNDLDVKEYKNLDLKDRHNQLGSKDCGYLSAVTQEMEMLSADERWSIRREMKAAVLEMLEHIAKTLPYDNKLLRNLDFLNPSKRLVQDVANGGVTVAKELNRFTESEISGISVQLMQYRSLQPGTVPEFIEDRQDRVDFFWVRVFGILEEVNGEAPKEVMKLVKLSLTLSHGQGMVERGFNITKQILHNRNSMSDKSVKAQKTVRQEIAKYGGAEKVPITHALLVECKLASRKEKEERQKEADEEARKEREAVMEAEALEKKKAEDESKKKHEEKRLDLTKSITSVEKIIQTKRELIRDAIQKGEKMKNLVRVQCNLRTIRFAEEEKEIQENKLKDLNAELAHHNSLKHKASRN